MIFCSDVNITQMQPNKEQINKVQISVKKQYKGDYVLRTLQSVTMVCINIMLKSNIHYYYKMLSLSIIHQFKGPIVNFVLCKPELTCCKNTSEIELKKL